MTALLEHKLTLARFALSEAGYSTLPMTADLRPAWAAWEVPHAEITDVVTESGRPIGALYAHANETVSVAATQRAMNVVVLAARAHGHSPVWLNLRSAP